MSCSTCPAFITGIIEQDVGDALVRVRRIKRLVTILNRALKSLTAEIIAEINALIALIPNPPTFDITQLIKIIQCPLTPQAVIVYQLDDLIAYIEKQTAGAGLVGGWALDGPVAATYFAQMPANILVMELRAFIKRVVDMINRTLRQIWEFIDAVINAGLNFVCLEAVDPRDPRAIDQAKQAGGATPYGTANTYNPPQVKASIGGVSYGIVPSALTPSAKSDRAPGTAEASGTGASSTTKTLVFSPQSSVLYRVAMTYWREIYRAMDRSDIFAARVAMASASSYLVKSTCPELYRGSIYEQYITETSTFSFDGFLPSGFDDAVKPFAESLAQLMIKIQSWEVSALVLALAA